MGLAAREAAPGRSLVCSFRDTGPAARVLFRFVSAAAETRIPVASAPTRRAVGFTAVNGAEHLLRAPSKRCFKSRRRCRRPQQLLAAVAVGH